MIRLDSLQLFAETVRGGSFSEAARNAGLTPGSVSRQIAELERSLGLQLFNRTTRQIALTEAGRVYFQHIEKVLEGVTEAKNAARALQQTPRGTLRIHSRTLFGVTILSSLLPEFQARYPDIRTELQLSERPVHLWEEDCDLDFRIAPPRDAGLMQRKLFSSERILIGSPDYLATHPPIRKPQDLRAHRCLAYLMRGEEIVWRFMRDGALEELPVTTSLAVNNGIVLRDLAVRGQGLALLDDYTVVDALASGALVRVLPDYRITNSTFDEGMYAAYREAVHVPEKIRAFLDYVSVEIKPIINRRNVVLAERSVERDAKFGQAAHAQPLDREQPAG